MARERIVHNSPLQLQIRKSMSHCSKLPLFALCSFTHIHANGELFLWQTCRDIIVVWSSEPKPKENKKKKKNWRNRRWRRYRASGSAKLKISKSFSTTQKSYHTTQLVSQPYPDRPSDQPTQQTRAKEKRRESSYSMHVFSTNDDDDDVNELFYPFWKWQKHRAAIHTTSHQKPTHTHTPHGMCFYLWIMANTLLHHCLLRLTKVVKVVVRQCKMPIVPLCVCVC